MGYGAIYEVARILDAFRRELPERSLTYNVGTVAGGTKVERAGEGETVAGKNNIVPPVAMASGDIRTISNEQTLKTEAKMQAIVAQHLLGTKAELTFSEGYPAMPPTEASRALLKTLNEANKALGFAEMPELDPMLRGAGDIAFVSDFLPGLAGIGATGTSPHAPGETVDLPSQVVNAKRDAVLMYRLSHEKQ
jgi:glutamate carboxypeptidase